jgi:hypothetical protein
MQMKPALLFGALSLATMIALPALAGEPPALEPGKTVCRGADGYAADFGGRRTFRWRPEWLAAAKASRETPAYRALMARADAALAGPTYTVVDKTRTPPSGDKHDYISMGPYWWPDPSRPNGEPYLRRDGQFNPERATKAFDASSMDAMSGAVEALSLAYYFTDDPKYATKAAQLLRVWFLDPATRMNPNARFAQGVPGRTPGRAEGVLDTFRLLKVVEAVGLLSPSGALDTSDQTGLEAWFAQYAAWMQSSPTGQEERAAKNNHGVWYDYQLTAFALFSRQPALARSVVAAAGDRRLAPQIAADGKLTEELQRTRALHYSYFSLEAMIGAAEYGRCVGLDLWRYKAGKGGGIRAALTFLQPYVGREKDFPYPEREPEDAAGEALPLFRLAAWAYGDTAFGKTADTVAAGHDKALPSLLIPPYAP